MYSTEEPWGNRGSFALFYSQCSSLPSPSLSRRLTMLLPSCTAALYFLSSICYFLLASFLPSAPPFIVTHFLPVDVGVLLLLLLTLRDVSSQESSGVKVQADALEALRLVLVGKVEEVTPFPSSYHHLS